MGGQRCRAQLPGGRHGPPAPQGLAAAVRVAAAALAVGRLQPRWQQCARLSSSSRTSSCTSSSSSSSSNSSVSSTAQALPPQLLPGTLLLPPRCALSASRSASRSTLCRWPMLSLQCQTTPSIASTARAWRWRRRGGRRCQWRRRAKARQQQQQQQSRQRSSLGLKSLGRSGARAATATVRRKRRQRAQRRTRGRGRRRLRSTLLPRLCPRAAAFPLPRLLLPHAASLCRP